MMNKTLIVIVLTLIPFYAFSQAKVGDKAPELLLKKAYNSNEVLPRLSLLEGKIVVLSFWATWCKYCIEDFPKYNELSKKYGSKGLQIIAISDDDTQILENYIDKTDIEFWIGHDKEKQDFKNYKIWFRPYSVIINREGYIIYKGNSYTEEQLVEAIETNTIDLKKD